ncbi:hypothetical protein N7510_011848 [Penicillium lagena]|uniref:uncharacterized protein n=1 Tax=Penicillium lagena TaxID=94218 RepID=UPI0025403A71|nr:uncharacterized protein N7510_011848 [Penicillium lagena]KAJ5598898.1 hypothetical protein N7510_011848 [Penicillium lagena]
MAKSAPAKFTLYTSTASQWAYVPHLALDQKGYNSDEYITRQIDLVDGENFAPEYVKINPNGTIPSLTSTSLQKPLIESTEILSYLDSLRPEGPSLFPKDAKQRSKTEQLIAHVHQSKLSTNLILLQARDPQELNAKRNSPWKDFIANRQKKLLKYSVSHPEIPLYISRTHENGKLNQLYNDNEIGTEHELFFHDSHQGYRDFATGLNELDSMLVLPYAAGDNITAADLHIVPWLAHALWGAGGNAIYDFEPLEKLIQKTVPDFVFGEKTKTWWKNISTVDAFKKSYPFLH